MKRDLILCGLAVLFGVYAPDMALAVDARLLAHPDPATAQYYAKNADVVDNLVKRVGDRQGPSAERAQAFEELQLSFPDAAFLSSLRLLPDPDETLAVAAARNLAAEIAMSNHPTAMTNMSPREHFLMAHYESAREALRSVLTDSRKPVREIAAKTLSSLADRQGLEAIAKAAKTGRLSKTEAVNYFGLANPDVGAKYMVPYVTDQQVGPRSAAVAYLAANREYQTWIKKQVFLNPSVDATTRTVAADQLSRYDPAFVTYGLDVTKDPKTPSSLYAQVVKGYLDKLQTGNPLGSLDDGFAKVEYKKPLEDAVENFKTRFPSKGSDAKVFQQKIDGIFE